jgi:hypothetical protein
MEEALAAAPGAAISSDPFAGRDALTATRETQTETAVARTFGRGPPALGLLFRIAPRLRRTPSGSAESCGD